MDDFMQQNKELQKAIHKAEESDRLKSAFLSNISHEIRTPLNGILGFSNLLRDNEYTLEERNHYIDIIQNSGQNLLSIITDIIDYSRIEAGIIKIEPKDCHLNKLMDERFFCGRNNFFLRCTTSSIRNILE